MSISVVAKTRLLILVQALHFMGAMAVRGVNVEADEQMYSAAV